MNNLRINLLSTMVLALLPLIASAQLSVEVDAPSSVEISDTYFQVRYRINTDQPTEIVTPRLDDFDRLSGPNISTRSVSSYSNGHTTSSSSTTYTYTLAPRRNGQFTISGGAIKVGGKTYKARSITIRVTGQGKPQSSGREAGQAPNVQIQPAGSAITDRDLYLTTNASNRRVYEQQPILLTYKFYQRPGIGLNTVSLNKKPDFKVMVSEDIPGEINITTETVNGTLYRTGIIQQYLVTPQQTGRLRVPGLTFDCVVLQRDPNIDLIDAFFNGAGNIGRTISRTSPSIDIEVLPLPQPRPAGFSGGVGQFTAKGEMLTPSPRTNDLITYRITIAGTGNLKLLTAPTVIFPTDFDSYPAKSTPNINVTRGGTTGNIVFDYTFVPRNVGQYEIPAVPFTYFDPEKGSYTTITIPAQSLNIQKGERSDEDVEQERHLISGDIPDIHTPTRTVKGTPTLFWGSLAYWGILVAICIGAIITIILLRHHIQKSGSTAKSRKSKSIRKALRSIKLAELQYDKDHNAPAFYGNIGLVIVRFISERWDIPESELSNERMKEILAANGIIPTTSAALLSLYERCQFARYAPGAAIEGIENMGRELRQLLNDIDHVSKAPKMKSAKASLLFFLLLALPAEASVTNRADSLYAAGKYAEACQLYEQARSQGLSGTDLYYNLGCTYYRQSDYVNAILNFERALRIDPADKDALYAIKFCRTHVTMPTEHTSTMFFITWADRFVRSYSADTWGTWSLCLLIAFFVTLAGYLLLHRKAWRKLSFTLMILAFLSFGLTQIAAGMQAHHYHEDRIAVIKSPTPLIAEDGKTVGQTLMPGVTIRILSKTENLLQIEIPVIGISGWVAEKDIERL